MRLTKAILATAAIVSGATLVSGQAAIAAPCLKVTLTGTQGGPPVFKGQAGAGTLVQYGDEADGCATTNLQFDAGRGTTQRLSLKLLFLSVN